MCPLFRGSTVAALHSAYQIQVAGLKYYSLQWKKNKKKLIKMKHLLYFLCQFVWLTGAVDAIAVQLIAKRTGTGVVPGIRYTQQTQVSAVICLTGILRYRMEQVLHEQEGEKIRSILDVFTNTRRIAHTRFCIKHYLLIRN